MIALEAQHEGREFGGTMKKNSTKPLKAGAEYEQIVAGIHREFAGDAQVTENEFITGRLSGKPRQIDVAIRSTIAGHKLLVIVECKDYRRSVGIDKVEELIGKVEDVGAATGVLVSNSGFSDDAVKRAEKDGRIQLATVIDVQNRKLRTYITIPCIYEHLSVMSPVEIRVIRPDGSPYAYSEYEGQVFMNGFIEDWNNGIALCKAGHQEHRRAFHNRYTNEDVGVQFFYVVKQELFYKRLDMTSGSGIYNVQSKLFRTNGFGTERFPVRVEDVRAQWKSIQAEDAADEGIKETTIHFRAIQNLDSLPLDGSRVPPY